MFYRPGSGTFFLNTSRHDGTFSTDMMSSSGIAGYSMLSGYDQIISLDYNGDGKDDIMCFRPGSGIVFINRSNGDGTFTKVYSSLSAGTGIVVMILTQQMIRQFHWIITGMGKMISCVILRDLKPFLS